MVHRLLALFIFLALIFLNHTYQGRSFKKAPSLYLSPAQYQYFHFGYKSLIADSLWVRLLPDIDTNIPLALDKKHTWQYEMIDAVVKLAPAFRAAYRNGGEVLSVILDDKDGARDIFERGLKQFPTYWPLQYGAAFHYMDQEHNPERAAELLLLANKNGGPDWFVSLAGKLYSEAGQKEMAIQSLLDHLKRYPTGNSREIVISRLKDLGVDPKPYLQD